MRSLSAGILVAVALCAGAALAQYRVNNQIYGNSGPSISYAGGHSSYGQATGSSVAMQSEVRNAAFRAGAMPSEVRMNYAALGPMMQGGPMAYIPASGPRYTVGSVGTVGNYLGPRPPSPAPAPSIANSSAAGVASGSVRYSGSTTNINSAALFPSVSTSAAKLTGSSLNTVAPQQTIPTNQLFGTPSLGSVRTNQ